MSRKCALASVRSCAVTVPLPQIVKLDLTVLSSRHELGVRGRKHGQTMGSTTMSANDRGCRNAAVGFQSIYDHSTVEPCNRQQTADNRQQTTDNTARRRKNGSAHDLCHNSKSIVHAPHDPKTPSYTVGDRQCAEKMFNTCPDRIVFSRVPRPSKSMIRVSSEPVINTEPHLGQR
jgi:hypothetical protein